MIRHAIIVPTKNREGLLRRAVESVQTQAYTSWRLIIINDGATDGTRDFLDMLVRQEPRVSVINRDESGGVNAARNAGLEVVEPDEFVTFLDDDDYFEPGALSEMSRLLGELPADVSVVCFNTYYQDKEGKREQGYEFDNDAFRVPTYADVMIKKRVTGDSLVTFRASLYTSSLAYRYQEDVNGFETEIFLKMVRDRVGIRYVPLVVATKDHSHDSPHLSEYAATTNPGSFAAAHERIFRDHAAFFVDHPRIATQRAVSAARVAAKAVDLRRCALFAWYWLLGFIRICRKRDEEE